MRIVIDLQGAQSDGSRNRGIGRYSTALAKSIARNRGNHEIIIVINGLFPNTIEAIRQEFSGLLSSENIHVWHAPGPVSHVEDHNNWRRDCAELVREAYIMSLKPDAILISSLFEGFSDNAVTSVGRFGRNIITAITIYDLIPYINRDPYLQNRSVERWYENKIGHLNRSDLLLSISESSRQEAIEYLDFSPDSVVNVGTAADSQFIEIEISSEELCRVKSRYKILNNFIMYTGGIDYRKNVEGLIRSYASVSETIRSIYQLAIVCSIQPADRLRLEELVKQVGLEECSVIFTGYVPEDDLIKLYNACSLFVFPSWHEGFGLPALEAMWCGAPVIGSNTSSLPEVIGLPAALFDPFDETDIAAKIEHALVNIDFREHLIRHGARQRNNFNWDQSGLKALQAIEATYNNKKTINELNIARRPTLAFVSPVPPAKSGIADYSADLLPRLSYYYDIDIVVRSGVSLFDITDPWIKSNCKILSINEFKQKAGFYDRILYQFGNSDHHDYMFNLLDEFPGVVVLHDFYLSGIIAYMDATCETFRKWPLELYNSHGYKAYKEYFCLQDTTDLIWKYPSNYSVLQNAIGVIGHSEYGLDLIKTWYPGIKQDKFDVIPLLKPVARGQSRALARKELGINPYDFVVCSFGHLGITKHNHRLLDAWLSSDLCNDEKCKLIFVGENDGGVYGHDLVERINAANVDERIKITGWTDIKLFRTYLAAADVGVQLRTLSRGETSAAAADCMAAGLATIVNANGSMKYLPADAVIILPDDFENSELIDALEKLHNNKDLVKTNGLIAQQYIKNNNSPARCANLYAKSIERFYEDYYKSSFGVVREIKNRIGLSQNAISNNNLINDIAENMNKSVCRTIFVDVSRYSQVDDKSGIQRVVSNILDNLLNIDLNNIRIEPVRAIPGKQNYYFAREFTSEFLECPANVLLDTPVEFSSGDIFIGLDLEPVEVPRNRRFFQRLRDRNVAVYFVIYDVLPIKASHYFNDGAFSVYDAWFWSVVENDGVICISQSVADEVICLLNDYNPTLSKPFKIGWFHLGSNVKESNYDDSLLKLSKTLIQNIIDKPTFLVVGTLEPRKGHDQILKAFDILWNNQVNINLVIVGKRGWAKDGIFEKIAFHAELNRRLIWVEKADDAILNQLYQMSDCLLFASKGEGFGLPLVEAARNGLPIITRDIPVVREVVGQSAYYFSGLEPEDLSAAVENWLDLSEQGNAPSSAGVRALTWQDSCKELLAVAMGDRWYREWSTNEKPTRFMASKGGFGTQVGNVAGGGMETTGKAGYLLFGPYVSLNEGAYDITIYGLVRSDPCRAANFDIAIDRGMTILSGGPLECNHSLGLIGSQSIILDRGCTDLEVRIHVASDTDMKVINIDIKPKNS